MLKTFQSPLSLTALAAVLMLAGARTALAAADIVGVVRNAQGAAVAGAKVNVEDAKGAAIKYTIDGAIDKLEMPNRGIVGTWTSGASKGKFEVHRQ